MDMAFFGNALGVNDLLTLPAGAYVSEIGSLSTDQVLTDEHAPVSPFHLPCVGRSGSMAEPCANAGTR
jgi:hypothetical protein